MKDVNLLAGFGFDPKWSIEEAYQAGHRGPKSPFHRWVGWTQLEVLKEQFNRGKSEALITAMYDCARHGLPLPHWVEDAFCKNFHEWVNYRVASLDEVFDVAIPKGAHFETRKEHRILKFLVPSEVERLKKLGFKTSKSKRRKTDVFDEVSKNIKSSLGASSLKAIYYKYRKYPTFQK